MAVRGLAQGCAEVARGSELLADAPVGSTVLTVEDTTDFDDDGGVIQLNDELLYYGADAIDEDAGTITLSLATTVAATESDRVFTMAGGKVLTDKVLFVSGGDGDAIEVALPLWQRDYWPEGEYDPPVPVVLSDDLEQVLDAPGMPAQSVELEEAKGGYDGSLQDIYDRADEAAAAAAEAASSATIAQAAANGKNKVTYSASGPGTAPNTAGDIWFQKDVPTQTIIGQWEGLGGTSWSSKTLRNEVIANLDAGKLVAGSAFVNGLNVLTNFTLGNASTNGVIQTYNFAGSTVGVFIDKFGIVAKGGSIAGADIIGGTVKSSSAGSYLELSAARGIGGALSYYYSGTLVGSMENSGLGTVWYSGDRNFSIALPINVGTGSNRIAVSGRMDLNGQVTATGAFTAASSFEADGYSTLGGGATINGGFDLNGGGTISGTVTMNSLSGTGGASYVTVGNAGVLSRGAVVSSSERYKTDIQPSGVNPGAVYEVEDVTYLWRDNIDGPRDSGVIAEQMHALGLTQFVGYKEIDSDLLPDGVDYIKFAAVAHQVAIRDLNARVAALEGATS